MNNDPSNEDYIASAYSLSQAETEVKLPLNLGLNDGTYMPQGCVEVLRNFQFRTALRNYSTPESDDLRETIARLDGVRPENIFLHNGTGPILKQVIPDLIKRAILSSPSRVARHLLFKNGFPIITPSFTYSKVPAKAMGLGLTVAMLPVGPENNFQINPADLEAALQKQDGLVYIVNPCNPTGNLMIDRDVLIGFIEKYPKSLFWVDEAYVQYISEDEHSRFSSLVSKYPNLLVSRTFSFAYGLASVRVGYLVTTPEEVERQCGKLTDYRVGGLAASLAVAALEDPDHLDFIRERCASQRALLTEGLAKLGGIEVFPSKTNFLLCRFTDGRKGADLHAKLGERKIRIKILAPFGDYEFGPYFRLTLGLEHENRFLLKQIEEVLTEMPAG